MGHGSRGLLGSLAADVARAATLETVPEPFGMLHRHLLGSIANTGSMLGLRALAHLQDTGSMSSSTPSTLVQYPTALAVVGKQLMQSACAGFKR